MKTSGSQKPVADSDFADIGFGNLGQGFNQSAGSRKAVFNQRNLILGKTDLFDEWKTLKSLDSILFFQSQFFRQHLVEGVLTAFGDSR